MPYSNDYTQIQSGLVNYIGAALQALPLPTAQSKSHYLTGELMKQITLLAKKENGFTDLYIYKPVFRSVIYVFQNEVTRMQRDLPFTKPAIESYQNMINSLTDIINQLQGEENAIQ
jgi:hypothetical protein